MSASVPVPLLPRPAWIRARAPQGPAYERLRGLMRGLELHTVCEEAHCPNLGECWSRGTATFMILGDVCTRACGFCAVKTGLPGGAARPGRAAARRPRRWRAWGCATRWSRRSTVTTSRTAAPPIFAATIAEIRARVPGCAVEVLIPDFKGRWDALQVVLDARPDILNHNIETVPRLYRHGAAGGELPALAGAAAALEAAGPADQERHHGRARRGVGRGRGDDPRDPRVAGPTS